MNIPYDPDHLSPLILREIHYFIALAALKKMCNSGDIPQKMYRQGSIALAKIYGVSPYDV